MYVCFLDSAEEEIDNIPFTNISRIYTAYINNELDMLSINSDMKILFRNDSDYYIYRLMYSDIIYELLKPHCEEGDIVNLFRVDANDTMCVLNFLIDVNYISISLYDFNICKALLFIFNTRSVEGHNLMPNIFFQFI